MIRTAALDAAAYRRYWWRRLGRALGWTALSGGWLWWRALQIVLSVAKRAPSYVEAEYWLLPGFRLEHDQLTPPFAARLLRCLRLWRPNQTWCLSGHGSGRDSRSEALAARIYLRDHGLPANARLVLDECARDSAENLQRLPPDWPPGQPIGLVSNRWHLARCAWLGTALGLRIKVCAAERRWRPGLGSWYMAAREALALLSWLGPEVRQLQPGQLLRPTELAAAPHSTRKFLTP